MARPRFTGSPTVGSDGPSGIFLARVTDVDMTRYTVNVRTEGSKRSYTDLPISGPYAHWERGEGFYVVPDVGAFCYIGVEGSGATPVVLGFGGLPKLISSSERTDPDATAQSEDTAMASYAYRRPKRKPGEFGFTARDGSFLHFRRGGIVELGSNGACQRIFLPLNNLITDVSENYQQWTAAGRLVFDTDRTEGSPGEDAKAKWRVAVKRYGVDSAASIQLDAGHLGDNRFRIAILENDIDLKTGEYTGASYEFLVDKDGKRTQNAEDLVDTVVGSIQQTCGSFRLETTSGASSISMNDAKIVLKAAEIELWGLVGTTGTLTVPSLSVTGSAELILAGLAYNLADLRIKYNGHIHSGAAPVAPGFNPVEAW